MGTFWFPYGLFHMIQLMWDLPGGWCPNELDRHGVAHMERGWVAAGLNHYGLAHRGTLWFPYGHSIVPAPACHSRLLHDFMGPIRTTE
jgi:hypothetical protein